MYFFLQLLLLSLTRAASLPQPDGPYNVGFSQYIIPHITPNDPTPGPGNALLAHLYYPTRDTNGSSPVPYIDPKSAIIWGDALELPRGLLGNLTTSLHGDASFLDAPTGHPTVLFSPAAGFNAWMYYGLLANLASHGYTILAIDHPGEPPVVRWPNGTDAIGLSIDVDFTANLTREVHEFRVTDLAAALAWFPSFVRKNHAPFDVSQFFALGHSIGGSASITFAPDHEQVRAAVNLDGGFSQHQTVVTNVGRPVFLMSSINHTIQGDPSWAEFQNHQTGWWEHIAIYGSGHLDYCDIAMWNEALGLAPLVEEQFGPVGGPRTTQIARKYVSDFFGWVEGRGKGVIASPSLKWREAIYVNGSDFADGRTKE
ncbi:Alpha/Beta hydrolase protein [Ilyonectria destructans]|nr:Alpha/Beta hydrolase protein [Ilyonectria destructans]